MTFLRSQFILLVDLTSLVNSFVATLDKTNLSFALLLSDPICDSDLIRFNPCVSQKLRRSENLSRHGRKVT